MMGLIIKCFIISFQAQIHLVGNVMVWTLGTFSVIAYIAIGVFYLLRQRRNCYDLTEGNISLKKQQQTNRKKQQHIFFD